MADYDAIESLFGQLLPSLAEVFSEQEVSQVSHYFDHGEYGVALDAVVGIFVEGKKIATPEVVALVSALANAMKLDSQDYQGQLNIGV